MTNLLLALLTGVLVAVTAYYSWQTHLTVRELRAARGSQVYPRLVPTLGLIGGGHAFLRVTNVGPGPAIEVQVRISLEPGGSERRWQTSVVAPGEHHDFIPAPGEQPNGLLHLDQLTAKYQAFRLRASYKDMLGERIEIDDTINVEEQWAALKDAQLVNPRENMTDIARSLDKLAKEVAKWTDGRGIRVFAIDKEAYDRRVYLRMAFDQVAREHGGDSPAIIRDALKQAAAGLGQKLEPPEEWVAHIVRDDDDGFVFQVPPA